MPVEVRHNISKRRDIHFFGLQEVPQGGLYGKRDVEDEMPLFMAEISDLSDVGAPDNAADVVNPRDLRPNDHTVPFRPEGAACVELA